jgi:hypothetical protein
MALGPASRLPAIVGSEEMKTRGRTDRQRRLDLAVTLERGAVLERLKMDRFRDKAEKIVDELLDLVRPVARPKALYRMACIDARAREWVQIDGVRFTSRILSKSLENVDSVIAYIVTGGRELEGLPVSSRDILRNYCLNAIKNAVLFQASQSFFGFLKEKYELSDFTHLHPGEFADWQIGEQKSLFSLFADTEEIGVRLTATQTIRPIQSGSGICFSNGSSFESCALCVQKCAGRRAPYDKRLVQRLME